MQTAQLKIVSSRKSPARTRPRTVVAQVRAAWGSPLSAWLGVAFGALVPLATFLISHAATAGSGWLRAWACALALGGLCYSAPTVFEWAREAMGSKLKAIGFVVLLEGVMVSADVLGLHWLGLVCLGYLIVINAAATACRFAFGDKQS